MWFSLIGWVVMSSVTMIKRRLGEAISGRLIACLVDPPRPVGGCACSPRRQAGRPVRFIRYSVGLNPKHLDEPFALCARRRLPQGWPYHLRWRYRLMQILVGFKRLGARAATWRGSIPALIVSVLRAFLISYPHRKNYTLCSSRASQYSPTWYEEWIRF